MTTKYIARLNGTVVGKRTTKSRTYTHAIVMQDDEETQRAYAYGYKLTDTDRANIVYYTEVAAQGVNHPQYCVTSYRPEPDHAGIAHAVAHLAGGIEGEHARLRQQAIHTFEKKKAEGGFEPYVTAWAGRPDLAQKAAASMSTNSGRYARVLVAIVPAEAA
jgi:hypothetical protein